MNEYIENIKKTRLGVIIAPSKEKFMKTLSTQFPGFNPLNPLAEKPKEDKQ
jgi:hypothetical protein